MVPHVLNPADGESKCRLLTDTLGFDDAVDYKADDGEATHIVMAHTVMAHTVMANTVVAYTFGFDDATTRPMIWRHV